MDNSKTINALNDLLQITNDRIEGFQKVEKKMIGFHDDLRKIYDHAVTQATQMRTELSSLVTGKGGDPDNSTTLAGGLHRTWIDVKNSLTGDRDESTLENVAFGEKAAVEAYENALESGDLCADSTKVVQDQLMKLRASYKEFSNMEERRD